MIMHLLIDDVKEGGWADIIARNGRAGKLVLEQLSGFISCLHMDHDLGGEISGLDIVRWALANGYLPDKVRVHSMNPPGREAIVNTLLDNDYQTIDNINFVRAGK